MNVLVYYIYPNPSWSNKAEDFYKSYNHHRPGFDHKLLIIKKEDFEDNIFDNHERIIHDNYGYDMGTLQKIAPELLEYDIVVQIGAHCRILTDDWLRKIISAFGDTNVAMVGTSASKENRPHIRTSNFAYRPQLMNLVSFPESLETKEFQYEVEYGENSLYNQFTSMGYACGIVDKNGNFFKDNWENTATFRAGEQENLLIADRHSDAYQYGVIGQRIFLENLAWGDTQNQ
jgi:hypothetical protein